jgi:hypothetical protein
MSMTITNSVPLTQTAVAPTTKPTEPPKAAEQPKGLAKDNLEVSAPSFGKKLLGIAGGTGAGIVGGTAASAALVLIVEKGVPRDFGGYVLAGGLLVGGGAGLLGAASSTFVANNPKAGGVIGAVVGGGAGAAYLGKTLGSVGAAVLGGAIGALAGGIGGYTAAKIQH